MEWEKNGELLGLMTLNGFDCFITVDKNLKNQQNLDKFSISVFVIMATDNRIETLHPFIANIIGKINSGEFGKLNVIY